jgi:hypothetical protein
MKKLLPLQKLLLYYSTAAALFLSLSGFISVKEIKNASFQLIFLPVTMFLFVSSSNKIKASLLKKRSDHKSFEKTKKNKLMVFFLLLYIALLTIGVRNMIKSKSNTSKDSTQETNSSESTPLIFSKKGVKLTLVQVNEEKVRIRTKPSLKSKIIKVAEKEERFELVEEIDEWYKIKLEDELYGYINKDFAETTKE